MRSGVFLTLSLIVHAICITALALSHFKSLERPSGDEVEVTMGEGSLATEGQPALTESSAPAVVEAPVVKPIESKPAEIVTRAQAIKTVEQPKPRKVAKKVAAPQPAKQASEITELPKKVTETVQPEQMDPQISDTEAVAIAPVSPTDTTNNETPEDEEVASSSQTEETKTEDMKVELIPAKEATSSAGIDGAEPTGTPTASAAPAAGLGKGGSSESTAVSYMNLKQTHGNRPPAYPFAARREKRQGEVELLYRVTKEGRVADIQIAKSSGHSDLDQEAVNAVSQFRFVPGQEGWAKHPVIFSLKGTTAASPARLRTGLSGSTTKSAQTE